MYAANELKGEGILGPDKNTNRIERNMIMAGRTMWADIQGEVTPERRKRIDAIKAQGHADAIRRCLRTTL